MDEAAEEAETYLSDVDPLVGREKEREVAHRILLSALYNSGRMLRYREQYEKREPAHFRSLSRHTWLPTVDRLKSEYSDALLQAQALANVTGGKGDGRYRTWIGDFEKSLLGQEIPGQFRTYALLLGAWKYTEWKQLDWVPYDLEKLRDALIDGQGFDRVDIIPRPQGRVTRDSIRDWLREVGPQLESKDRVLIYYSGHGEGIRIGNVVKGFLPLEGASRNPPKDPKHDNNRISMDDLRSIVSRIPVRHKLVIIDACCAGLLVPQTKSATIERMMRSLKQSEYKAMVTRESAAFLLAGADRDAALARSEWSGSLVTEEIVRGLRGAADSNEDGIIGAYELFDYVKLNTLSESGSYGLQTPLLWVESSGSPGEFVFGVPPTARGTHKFRH